MAISCRYLLLSLIFFHIISCTSTASLHLRLHLVQKRSLEDWTNSSVTNASKSNVDSNKVEVSFNKSFVVHNFFDEGSSNLTEGNASKHVESVKQSSSMKPTDKFNDTATINSEIFTSNMVDINQIAVSNTREPIANQNYNASKDLQLATSSTPVHQTKNDIESTTFMLYDSTSVNQTYAWGLLFNDKTETIPMNISTTVETNNEFSTDFNATYQEAFMVHMKKTYIDENRENLNESFIVSFNAMNTSVCNLSCQCLRQCPYGFQVLNNACLCNLPCQNYQCFDDDKCVVTEQGKPLCQRRNGSEYDRPTRCYQPRDPGYHDARIQYSNRWYYNPDQNACHLFVYRGLGGNENNFRTLHECHIECIICATVPEPGECLGQFNMWYYDKRKHECIQFEYSGCKGNENKFLDKKRCVDTCIGRIFNMK